MAWLKRILSFFEAIAKAITSAERMTKKDPLEVKKERQAQVDRDLERDLKTGRPDPKDWEGGS